MRELFLLQAGVSDDQVSRWYSTISFAKHEVIPILHAAVRFAVVLSLPRIVFSPGFLLSPICLLEDSQKEALHTFFHV